MAIITFSIGIVIYLNRIYNIYLSLSKTCPACFQTLHEVYMYVYPDWLNMNEFKNSTIKTIKSCYTGMAIAILT